jgi:hypothetical protein
MGGNPFARNGMFRDVEYLTDAPPDPSSPPEVRQRVTALYQAHALGLVKLAKIMLGDQAAAEDIVQDAFPAGHFTPLSAPVGDYLSPGIADSGSIAF